MSACRCDPYHIYAICTSRGSRAFELVIITQFSSWVKGSALYARSLLNIKTTGWSRNHLLFSHVLTYLAIDFFNKPCILVSEERTVWEVYPRIHGAMTSQCDTPLQASASPFCGATLPKARDDSYYSSGNAKGFPRISRPVELLRPEYDVVVIGSGYGGGVAASRMARGGQSVCLLELGREKWRMCSRPRLELLPKPTEGVWFL